MMGVADTHGRMKECKEISDGQKPRLKKDGDYEPHGVGQVQRKVQNSEPLYDGTMEMKGPEINSQRCDLEVNERKLLDN